MSQLRFKPGDLAVAVVARPRFLGLIVEIVSQWPEPEWDYIVFVDGEYRLAKDYMLRRLDPPQEPASLTRREEIGVGV